MNKIRSILIANRGEIASRIIRTCRKMGIRSIAIYTDADQDLPYVDEADLAVHIGGNSPNVSYLDQDKVINIAKKVNADAIHPGYGFLSENAMFAQKCADEDVIFIGPHIEAIRQMGSKSNAKALMQKLGVPIVPGYVGDDQSDATLVSSAHEIGFPVLLKATAGGGGKGMRIVHIPSEIDQAILAARREAENAFGDGLLIVEKYISSGRHIEFQIFGDQHGNVIHILERECTIQRRYQKIIEETPSPIMSQELRSEMGATAIKIAKGLHYDNAGTVEFIYDDKTRNYYFLEVNTRLQVEHPVTEEVTGIDLVQMQIESAQGDVLRLKQSDIVGRGYAIEARLYAEDPDLNFFPVTGQIKKFEAPDVEGLRIETTVQSGSEVSVYYDPMIAKLIVWSESRESAGRKMEYVLKNLICLGVKTNQAFLLSILQNSEFQKGIYNTHFIHEVLLAGEKKEENTLVSHYGIIAAVLYRWLLRNEKRYLLGSLPSGWRSNPYSSQRETYIYKEVDYPIEYKYDHGKFEIRIEDKDYQVRISELEIDRLRITIDGIQYQFTIAQDNLDCFVHSELFGNIAVRVQERFPQKVKEIVKGEYESPMPSQIIKVLVSKGENVEADMPLIVLSSMKMENTIYAKEAGIVEEIYVQEGMNIEAGFLLIKVTP